MRIENKLTVAHLKQNKKRTIITSIGIIISVAMIVSVFIGIAAFMDYNERMVISLYGNSELWIADVTKEKLDILKNDDRIESVGLSENGRSDTSGVRLEGAKSLRHSTGYINWYNADMFSQMYIDELEGAFPKNSNEILLTQRYIDDNELPWKVGDTITLQLGKRYNKRNDKIQSEFFNFTNTGEYEYGEEFDFCGNRKFKIAGIIKDDVTGLSKSQMYSVCDDDSVYSAHIKLKKVNPFSMSTINSIAKELGINPNKMSKSNMFLNNELLATHFCGSLDSDMVKKYIPMGLAVLLIILVTAFMLIYNAFGISLSERTKYLGMLSSVGATKKQKIHSIYFEGFILSIIGIPIGTLLGTAIMAAAIKLIPNNEQGGINPRFTAPIWAMAFAIVFCVAIIFISLRIPAKKASAASAIDSIRQSDTFKVKSTRNPWIIKKIFGIEGVLAYKNFKRNGRKSKLVTISIAISVVLFLCVNYYCSVTSGLVMDDANIPYKVEFAIGSNLDSEQVLKDIEDIDGVKDVYSINQSLFTYGKAGIGKESDRTITKGNNTTEKYKNLWQDVNVYVTHLDDDDFNELCKKNGIDPKPYYQRYGKARKCIIMNNFDHKANGDKIFNDNIIGEKLASPSDMWLDMWHENEDLPAESGYYEMSREDQELFMEELDLFECFIISGIVDYDENNYACNLDPVRSISAYAPYSMMPVDDSNELGGNSLYGVETDDHKDVTEKISSYFDNYPDVDDTTWVSDRYGYVDQTLQRNKTIKIFMYGFILLISMISLANIINVISTSINSRKREFSMIKSVGITPKGFSKMIALESFFYGIGALFVSIPISIGINLGLNKIVADGKIPFEVNWLMLLIVICAVFAFVGGVMLYSISKIKNDNIIENLKNDVL